MVGRSAFPLAVRVLAVVWLLGWGAAYGHHYGPVNFLRICDVAVILTVVGLVTSRALPLSVAALPSMVLQSMWSVDFLAALLLGCHVIGGTEYMWEERWPLYLRLLSLFHLAWPPLLLWALRRTGYDRRALLVHTALSVPLFAASWMLGREWDVNNVVTDPVSHRTWGPPAVHVTAMLAGLFLLIALPTHLVLRRVYGEPPVRT